MDYLFYLLLFFGNVQVIVFLFGTLLCLGLCSANPQDPTMDSAFQYRIFNIDFRKWLYIAVRVDIFQLCMTHESLDLTRLFEKMTRILNLLLRFCSISWR